ncbi:DUF2726 domain-containing protein [Gallaecimonas kandeliae]|uniref:DUF2726 domain-containing protein n=1 Tax=Gallaecimonas kandeliae TaxID=3029055 RepID=UPI0026499A04|nr:DUF2726 domain-containing protein [Gallaecimonas kandeliae]WKE66407.1 DUF2726 domain-containing protein [Gallaecimonas kandeliae]
MPSDDLQFLLPFILAGAGLLLLSLLIWLLSLLRLRRPYERQPLLTEAEMAFLPLLDAACDPDYRVFTKVRWADVIGVQPRFKGSDHRRAFEKICAKRLDFVLCRRSDLAVSLVLELAPQDKVSRARKQRDKQLARICQQIGLPLLVVKSDSALTALHLRERIEKTLRGQPLPASPAAALQAQETPDPGLPSLSAVEAPVAGGKHCPKCDALMSQRQVSKGKYAGQRFWTCSAYPLCKTVLPLDEPRPQAQPEAKPRAEVVQEGLFTLKASR